MWGVGKGSSPAGPESSGERALFRELADMQAAGEARRSARERRGSPSRSFSRSIPLLAAAACFSAFLAVFAGGASAVHDLGLFQLDGNAAVDASPAGEDWNSVVGNGTGSLPLAGSNAISATFVNDPYNVPNGDSAYGAGSSKDIDDVPKLESYTLAGNVNDKLDFEHAGRLSTSRRTATPSCTSSPTGTRRTETRKSASGSSRGATVWSRARARTSPDLTRTATS